MENILQDIIQSEEEALRLEEEAKQQALDLMTEARKRAEGIMEKSLLEGEAMVDEMLQKARNEALDERKQNDNADLDSDRLNRDKINTAADFIVGRIVNKSWQW